MRNVIFHLSGQRELDYAASINVVNYINYIRFTSICQLNFSACNAQTYFQLHLILAEMKLLITLTVLLVLLGNSSTSYGLTPYQSFENRMRLKYRLLPIQQGLKKNRQEKPKGISPTFEVRASAHAKRSKIKVCPNGVILNNVRRWRKHCNVRITQAWL